MTKGSPGRLTVKGQPYDPKYDVFSLFPCTLIAVMRDTDSFDSTIEAEAFEEIIASGMKKNIGNSNSRDLDVLSNKKLKHLKEHCQEAIDAYISQILNPVEGELDFYITQSWLNITKPGECHHGHFHTNSILSGVYYIATVEDDSITFHDPNFKVKAMIKINPSEANIFNCNQSDFAVQNLQLLLFPSWMEHAVGINEKATTDRISISFNTFARGNFGCPEELNALTLK